MTKKKLRVGILLGGSSSEKEVSLEGGRNVFLKLDQNTYQLLPIFVDKKHQFWQLDEKLIVQNTTDDLQKLALTEAKRIYYEDLKNLIDFAFIVGHGKYMEDGCLQGFLELQKIPYNGPGVLGSALGADKYVSRRILQQAGIDVPKYLPIFFLDWHNNKGKVIKEIKEKFSFPFVIKPSREGCSTDIHKIKSETEIEKAFSSCFRWDSIILAEEALEGREITISVLGNNDQKALPITETPPSGMKDYLTLEDKFLPGGAEMITPANLSQEETEKAQNIALKVCQTLDLFGYSRIDMFYTKDQRMVVLEANTLPGITPSTMIFHQAAEIGLSPSQYLDKIIQLGLNAHQNKKGPL